MTRKELSASLQIQATLSHFRDLLNSVECPKCYSKSKVKQITEEINNVLLPMWATLHNIYKGKCQEQEPQGLDEAAEEWSEVFISEECKEACNYGFRVGAKWMAEQGYSSEAIVGGVILPDGKYRKVANFCSQSIRDGMDNLNLSKGDKVIVQIRKK